MEMLHVWVYLGLAQGCSLAGGKGVRRALWCDFGEPIVRELVVDQGGQNLWQRGERTRGHRWLKRSARSYARP